MAKKNEIRVIYVLFNRKTAEGTLGIWNFKLWAGKFTTEMNAWLKLRNPYSSKIEIRWFLVIYFI